ncbi:PAS domain-containing protein [Minwuia sp.]|uniref:PAS domain-containing protein n=1 Tax=Minwuia sp. TaxID=2493630 RepID=UPI003A8FE801
MTRNEIEQRLIGAHCRRHHDYWWELRARSGDAIPTRGMFDPAQVKTVLPFVLLHDLSQPDKSILRLIGTAISERFGFDPTGRDYLEFVSEDRRATAYRALWNTATQPCGMRVVIEARYRSGKRTVGESMGYPLTGSRGQPLMMFVDELIEKDVHDLDQRAQPLDLFHVRERDFVDVGFGVPEPV